jgi:hypothetical protein
MPKKTPAKKAAAPKGNILEYLEKLPSPYKEMAIYNYHKQEFSTKNNNAGSLYQALGNAFHWEETEQGNHFWDSLYDAISDGSEYPEIPNVTEAKTWSGIVPDYNIVVDKKKSKVIVGCQEIDLDTFKQFVEEFNEFVE